MSTHALGRRQFIKLGSALAGCALLGNRLLADENHYPFGIQLFTVRRDMQRDADDVLRQLSSFGYHQIQSFEGARGMFWGRSPRAFREFINDLGMELVASHCNINEGFERKAEQAAQAGLAYLVCPMIGPQDSLDGYRRWAETFNRCGEICEQAGLGFAYHNHAYTFMLQDEEYPQDVLMRNTDPSLVDFELDMYWVDVAGADIEQWLQKYPGRFVLGHVKDRLRGDDGEPANESGILGTGTIDYPRLLPAAHAAGMRYFLVEQEAYRGTTPLESSRENARFMQQFQY